MPPPPRRSNRLKRRAAQPAPQTPKKRVKPDKPKPSPSNAQSAPSKPPSTHSKRSRSQAAPARRPSQRDQFIHEPTEQTLFLGNDFETLHWQPPQTKECKGKSPQAFLRDFKFNVQEYFTSVRAGRNAAFGRMFMYRHIGSVVLDKFGIGRRASSKEDFQSVMKSEQTLVNLNRPINGAKSSNQNLLSTLRSLTRHSRQLWPGPFIVTVANRQHVMDVLETKRNPPSLTVQVYAGRMLFELIACNDIKYLFNALMPSLPYKPLPELKPHPKIFTRSSPCSESNGVSFDSILRNAESLGYSTLTDTQRRKVNAAVDVELYSYQEQTVRWMLDMENGPNALNDFFWEERFFTGPDNKPDGSFYYFPLTGELRLQTPPRVRGGMITEEMGLGKTVEALALIAAQRTANKPRDIKIWCDKDPSDVSVRDGFVCMRRVRQRNQERTTITSSFHHGDEVLDDAPDDDFPKNVKVRRWPPQTTLVVCPRQLVGQWKQEANRRAPSLTVELWESDADADVDRKSMLKDSEAGHEKASFAVGENAKDIVICSYDALKKDHILSQIYWRRIILDEAQMTRRSAAQIAQDAFNLRAESRFLMTGTPIVNTINDIKGELAMLKVWPFTLDNDGFWERHIFDSFIRDEPVPLLDHLLKVTMMRHTKGQNLGITLPPRQYETVEVDLVGSHRAIYCYVLGSCLEELEAQGSEVTDTRRLRILMRLMVATCLSPMILDLSTLDLARRHTWSRRRHATPRLITLEPGDRTEIRKVSPSEAIEFVAESTARVVRETGRSFATGHAGVSNELDRFLRMPLEQLREEVLSKTQMPRSRVSKLQRERLAALAAGGVHRLATDTLRELRTTAVSIGIACEGEAKKLSRAAAMAKLQLHYDILRGINRARTVHESGFTAITKIMEGKGNPNCPVCLTDCDERVSVTKCGHIYCYDCVVLMLESSGSSHAPCAICRRELYADNVVEIERPTVKHEAEKDENVIQGDVKQEPIELDHDTKPEAGKGIRDEREGRSDDIDSSALDDTDDDSKPTAQEAWTEYENLGQAPSRFLSLGRDSSYPSLEANFLRHIAAVREGLESPKLAALHSLIQSSPEGSKFCVVAASIQSLRVIHTYLLSKNIKCVGAGIATNQREQRTDASSEFEKDPDVRVFLLNPANASGLTLIAAQYVIFMETLVRVADEVQAAARVHRIGQTKPVKIIRIVARNTVEQHMIKQRGEIRSPEEESAVLSAVSSRDASDRVILDLLRDE